MGIAIGGLGSDAAIETGDVVIQTNYPSQIATARRIAVATHTVVWQNILTFAGKAVVLALGDAGLATCEKTCLPMWASPCSPSATPCASSA